MNMLTMAFILALLVAVWWLVRKRRESVADQTTTKLRSNANTKYHAVSIKYSGRVCDAAKDLSGRRFLASAAPKIPLPECDVLACSCRFVHHKDRRSSKDRRSPFGHGGGSGGTGAHETEQRTSRHDRRQNDD